MIVWAALAAPAGPPMTIDEPARQAVACGAADGSAQADFREGVRLSWRTADALLPNLALERSLVRVVTVRATGVEVCDGRLILVDPSFQLTGARGLPVEAVLATRLQPGPVLAVGSDDVQVTPPPGSWRIVRRDTIRAYGAWDVGGARAPR